MIYNMLYNKDILRFTIPLLHYCNLSCSYCHVPNERHEYLDFETYTQGVDFFYQAPGIYKNIILYWWEPLLLKDDELDRFISYALEKKSLYPDKIFEITVVTNLTCFRESLIPILEKADNIAVSIDGKKESHDANRGLFDVTYQNFQKLKRSEKIMLWATTNKVVNKVNVHTFYEDTLYLYETFWLPVFYNQALSVGDWDQPSLEIFQSELDRIYEYVFEHKLFDRFRNFFKIPMKSCPYGTLSMALDGKVYNCEFIANDYINKPKPVIDLKQWVLKNKNIENCYYDISSEKCLAESCLQCGTTCTNFSFQSNKKLDDSSVDILRNLKRSKSQHLPKFKIAIHQKYGDIIELEAQIHDYHGIYPLFNFIYTFVLYFDIRTYKVYIHTSPARAKVISQLISILAKRGKDTNLKFWDVSIEIIASPEHKDIFLDLDKGLCYKNWKYYWSIHSEIAAFFIE